MDGEEERRRNKRRWRCGEGDRWRRPGHAKYACRVEEEAQAWPNSRPVLCLSQAKYRCHRPSCRVVGFLANYRWLRVAGGNWPLG